MTVSVVKEHGNSNNPRLDILRREIEQSVLKHFRSHEWSADIVNEVDRGSFIEIGAARGTVKVRIAVLYSSSEISNAQYRELSERVDHIFFQGRQYRLDSLTHGVTVPVEPLDDFFPFLVDLNKKVEPTRSVPTVSRKVSTVRRLTGENPHDAVVARLKQFTSVTLAKKLVARRAEDEGHSLTRDIIDSKATGIAYSMRSALDYLRAMSNDKLNRRVVSLYYGTMALAQAEMLALPSGPGDLDKIEGVTKNGHGLYALARPSGGFAEIRVGVLARGFLPVWLNYLGHDTTGFPNKRAESFAKLEKRPPELGCSLRYLFASMPEINDLFSEVFGGSPNWISVAYDTESNRGPSLHATVKKIDSSYALFIDRSGRVAAKSLADAGWPLAEIQQVKDHEGAGISFRARVDHAGHDYWWGALPLHHSPFRSGETLLFPTVGGQREYRTIATTTLYVLSIMARYMPSTWHRIEGGDEDQYLALVYEALAVWERLLPEQFLESITGEKIVTVQPGSILA